MKRRGFLALFGGGVAAAVTKTSVALPVEAAVPVPPTEPALFPFGYIMQVADTPPTAVTRYIRLITKIFDGDGWVVLDSPEGRNVLNRSYELYQRTLTEGHQT